MLSWQEASVNSYLTLTGSQLYPGYGTGRGYPDVAMMGNNYIITTNSSSDVVSGTSASAPVFAGNCYY